MTAQEVGVGSADGDPNTVVRCLAALILQAWHVDTQLTLPTEAALQPLVPVYGGNDAEYSALALHVVVGSLVDARAAESPVWSSLINAAVMSVGDTVFSSVEAATHAAQAAQAKSASASVASRRPGGAWTAAMFSALVSVGTLMRLLHFLPPSRVLRLSPSVAHLAAMFQALAAIPEAHLPLPDWGADGGGGGGGDDPSTDPAPAPLALSRRFLRHLDTWQRSSVGDVPVEGLAVRSLAEQVIVLACSMLSAACVRVAESVVADVTRAVADAQRGSRLRGGDHDLTVFLLVRVVACAMRHRNSR